MVLVICSKDCSKDNVKFSIDLAMELSIRTTIETGRKNFLVPKSPSLVVVNFWQNIRKMKREKKSILPTPLHSVADSLLSHAVLVNADKKDKVLLGCRDRQASTEVGIY